MQIKELVEKLVQALVDSPEDVRVVETEGTNMTLLQIKVSRQDVGKLIGKKGKNINAVRTIVAGAGKGKRYIVEVVGESGSGQGTGSP
ncbi:MAG: KH domain-containing protein [Deltaproteobacteria bacterium]|nr:KH domain-containing protein [Deltaproteobacteria bacterium]MBW2123297.1 KH domain-containing protein [Deltaproteobacteria bacterium]